MKPTIATGRKSRSQIGNIRNEIHTIVKQIETNNAANELLYGEYAALQSILMKRELLKLQKEHKYPLKPYLGVKEKQE